MKSSSETVVFAALYIHSVALEPERLSVDHKNLDP